LKVDDDVAKALAGSLHMAALQTLNLWGTQVGDDGVSRRNLRGSFYGVC
jgi:hypothetical protein